MTAYLLTDHLLNFVAPAAVMALLFVLSGRLFKRLLWSKVPLAQSFIKQFATVFIVNVVVLVAGLVFFGHDGKMVTYAAMVVASAMAHWILVRGWQK